MSHSRSQGRGPIPCHSPVQCIVPDHMLLEIARRGSDEQRAAAHDTLAVSTTLRSSRSQAEAFRSALGSSLAATPPLGAPAVDRVVRDAHGTENQASAVVRREGDGTTGDTAVDEAYDYLGATWDFWFQVFARNSLDNAGLTLDAVVHFGDKFDNAFFDGAQMVFGDGSGTLFTRLTKSLTVCAHELGHGIIQTDGPLVYKGQSGALNEHIADAFGVMVHQWKHGETAATADWLVGSEILAPGVHGTALRSMKAPGTAYDDPVLGKDPQPAHMDHFVVTARDNGGVHINSGIPNKAFYEIATAIGGPTWEGAGRILYTTLGNAQLRRTSSFAQFAALNHRVATQLYGATSTQAVAVQAGWKVVGIEI